MGRVYDALKRAEGAQRHNHKPSDFSGRRNGNPDNVSVFAPTNGQRSSVVSVTFHGDAGGNRFSAHCAHSGGDRRAGTPRRTISA
jgi:hypothetical protein